MLGLSSKSRKSKVAVVQSGNRSRVAARTVYPIAWKGDSPIFAAVAVDPLGHIPLGAAKIGTVPCERLAEVEGEIVAGRRQAT